MIKLERLNSVSVMTSNVGSTHMTPREDYVRLSDARTYGDQRAAEAREQMRDELIAHWKKQKFMTLNPEDSAQNQRVQGMKSCNQNYIEYLEKLK